MENNNTQSKVDGEKPDFEKMLQKSAFKCHPLDIEPNAIMISKAEYLMDELWDTYVSPLHSRIKGLEQERDAALKERDEILERADARIKELESSQSWVSVKERLPESNHFVLCIGANGPAFTGIYTKGHEVEYENDDYDGPLDEVEEQAGVLYLKQGWYECEEQSQSAYDECWMPRLVTHWQPLPSKPENK